MLNIYSRSIMIVLFIFWFNNIRAQEVFRVTNGGQVSLQAGAEITVLGDVVFDNGSTVINNGVFRVKRNGASGTGNFTDNSVSAYSYGTGRFIFNSNGSNNVNSIALFPTVEINNGGLILLSDITALQWHLTTGKITTGSFKAIANSTNANAVEADVTNTGFVNGWFNGRLRRFISPATVNTYEFPVGDVAKVNNAIFDNLLAAPFTGTTYIDALFGPKPGNDVGLLVSELGTAYTSVNSGGVWYLTPDVQPTAGKYDLKLYFTNFSGLTDNAFGILKRPDASNNASDWQVPVGSVLPAASTPGRIVSAGFARRNNIGSFSQFGIGMSQFALPITLVQFNARRTDAQTVILNWETAQEQNNNGFEIERRLNNENLFSKIGFVPSLAPGGNSSTALNYSYTDFNNFAGESYYRLKQVDLDNKFEYSKVVKVNMPENSQMQLYPNPAVTYTLLVFSKSTKKVVANIFSANGQLVKSITIADGQNQQLIDVATLAKGEYTIRITNGETSETLKLLKQ